MARFKAGVHIFVIVHNVSANICRKLQDCRAENATAYMNINWVMKGMIQACKRSTARNPSANTAQLSKERANSNQSQPQSTVCSNQPFLRSAMENTKILRNAPPIDLSQPHRLRIQRKEQNSSKRCRPEFMRLSGNLREGERPNNIFYKACTR